MKKTLSVLLCAVSIIIFCLMPATVFGATTEYNSGINWGGIITDNGLTIGTNYFICRDTSGYYYICYSAKSSGGSSTQGIECNNSTIADTTELSYGWDASNVRNYKYRSSSPYNPYGTYEVVNDGTSWTISVSNVSSVMANSKDIYYNDVSVFQQVPLTQTGLAQGTTVTLSGTITSEVLQGVLIEVTGILPILVPTLITFISIRKGLRFTLAMLRRA